MKYGFIGIGKMGGAILSGLLASGAIKKEEVLIAGRSFEKTLSQAEELGVSALESKSELTRQSDIIIIGVEPGSFPDVMPDVKEGYSEGKLIISMAAGITIESIESYFNGAGEDACAKIIRIMPNAPARVGEIMVSISRNSSVSDEEMRSAVRLFSSMGKAEEVPEDMINVVIGVSGSSPAYTYMYIKALSETAESYGMDFDEAMVFAAQAVLGSAKIVLEECKGKADIDTLIDNVCTPGGTTIEAVKSLKENGFEEIVRQGAASAIEKSILMSRRKK